MGYLLDTLDQEKLTGQIDVVRNERRQSVENAPYGLVEEEMFHQLFPKGHPYYASVIGSHADLEAVRLEDVREFFREYYAPNNASLAIVGDIDKAQRARAGGEVLRPAGGEQAGREAAVSRRRRSRPRSASSSPTRWNCRASTWPGSRRRSTSPATPNPTCWRCCSAAASPAGCTRTWSTTRRSRRT